MFKLMTLLCITSLAACSKAHHPNPAKLTKQDLTEIQAMVIAAHPAPYAGTLAKAKAELGPPMKSDAEMGMDYWYAVDNGCWMLWVEPTSKQDSKASAAAGLMEAKPEDCAKVGQK